MKRIICFLICLLMLFSFVGCDSDTTPVLSGSYYAVGDYEEMLTPYLSLDTDNNEFRFGAGSVVSYQEYGSYKIADGKIIATSQSTTFEFEIKDKSFNYAIGQITAGGIKRAGASAAATVVMMMVPIMVFVITQSNIIETMGSSGMKD